MISPDASIPDPPEWWEIGGIVNVLLKDSTSGRFFVTGNVTVTGGLGYARKNESDRWTLVQCMGVTTEDGIAGPVYVLRALSRP